MINRWIVGATALLVSMSALAQESAEAEQISEAQRIYQSLDFQAGPGTYDVTSRAVIELPEGYDRLDPSDTAKLMELYGNITTTEEWYVAPVDQSWFAVFSYEDSGYIKDDEEIDSGALLRSVREGTEAANAERRRLGWAEMNIIGWQFEPRYSDETNRLSWAILAESEGDEVINYNTRLLGRTGVMSAVLVADTEGLDDTVAEFEQLLTGFTYKPGNLYSEYREGDKLAKYGLAALVTGGAAVAVAKSKGFIKLIIGGIVAFFAFFGNMFKRMFSRNKE
ncbi:MAG: DUF2167 domain-containing protein [Pseudomonadota bacterium]